MIRLKLQIDDREEEDWSLTLLTLEGVDERRQQGSRQGSKRQTPKLCKLMIMIVIIWIMLTVSGNTCSIIGQV